MLNLILLTALTLGPSPRALASTEQTSHCEDLTGTYALPVFYGQAWDAFADFYNYGIKKDVSLEVTQHGCDGIELRLGGHVEDGSAVTGTIADLPLSGAFEKFQCTMTSEAYAGPCSAEKGRASWNKNGTVLTVENRLRSSHHSVTYFRRIDYVLSREPDGGLRLKLSDHVRLRTWNPLFLAGELLVDLIFRSHGIGDTDAKMETVLPRLSP